MDVSDEFIELPPELIPKQRRRWLRAALILALSIIVLGGVVLLWRSRSADSPVPPSVRSTVSFPVYYPQQAKLPGGYRLDTASFRTAESQVVLFWIIDSHGQKLTFSEEQPPSSAIIDKFLSTSIPLRTSFTTPLGKAEIGAVGSGQSLQSVVSLVINKGPWLIITSPANTPQDDLKQIVQSLKH